jgi:hypothetical protein
MKSLTRNGTDRRDATRGPDRRSIYDIRTILAIMGENTEAISALLTFVPYVTLAVDADSARAKAADLSERNSFLSKLLPYAS